MKGRIAVAVLLAAGAPHRLRLAFIADELGVGHQAQVAHGRPADRLTAQDPVRVGAAAHRRVVVVEQSDVGRNEDA